MISFSEMLLFRERVRVHSTCGRSLKTRVCDQNNKRLFNTNESFVKNISKTVADFRSKLVI